VPVGKKPNLVASKTAPALGRMLRLEPANAENTNFAAGGCSTDLVLNLVLGCSDGISGVSILWLETISSRQVVCTLVSGPRLGMFPQPPGVLARP